jgi:cystathionine beta-lyase/cystathionine gamma-synthase
MAEPLDPATIVAHDEGWPDGAVVPPIFQTSLFTFGSYQALEDAMAGRTRTPIYSRGDNPTVQAFEAKLAALEGAEAARAFASGMAAISAAVLANLQAGERMLCVRHCYPDAYRLFTTLLPRFDIRVEFVDGRDAAAIERALPGVKLLYLESPTSVVFETQDFARLAAAARAEGALTIADNSWASPIFQRPLAHGVDLVVHSASKYLGGHSDTVAGVVCGRAELIARINQGVFPLLGGKLAPLEGWLLLRGLRTLPLRMRRHHESGLALAGRLAAHPRVRRVNHPLLRVSGAAGGTLAGASGLFSFELDGDQAAVRRFCDALRLFKLGVSWGGHESLAFPVAAGLEQAGAANPLRAFGVAPETIRLHIGLEDPEDLWSDLARALETKPRRHQP